ncbi:hypothetical protein IMY05_C4592000200 [Salix suchowensis]|nr:hypothetical protein IMY05_C4592000200 [Salix suchowensis]
MVEAGTLSDGHNIEKSKDPSLDEGNFEIDPEDIELQIEQDVEEIELAVASANWMTMTGRMREPRRAWKGTKKRTKKTREGTGRGAASLTDSTLVCPGFHSTKEGLLEDAGGCSEFDDDEHRQDPFADDVGGMIEEEGDKRADEETGESAGPMEAHEYARFSWPWRPANVFPKDKRAAGPMESLDSQLPEGFHYAEIPFETEELVIRSISLQSGFNTRYRVLFCMACGTAVKGASALLNHLQEKHGSHMKPSHYKKRLSEWIRLPLEDLPDSKSFDKYFLPRYEMARKLSSHPIIKGLPPPVLGFVCKCGHGCPPRIRSGSSSEGKSVIEVAKTALRSHGKVCPELTPSEFNLRASGPLVPLQAFSTIGNGARYFQVTQDVKEVGAPLPRSALTPADKYLREAKFYQRRFLLKQ